MADTDELEASVTPGWKGPGVLKTREELQKLDYRDDSLKKWEESVGMSNGTVKAGSGPKVSFVAMRLESPSRQQGPIVFDLSKGSQTLEAYKKEPVSIKEGTEYSVSIVFRVNHSLVSGLKFLQVVKRAGITVDKLEKMVGSFGPGEQTQKFLDEEAPSGMLARSGTYLVRSRLTDDDKEVHLDFEWSFKLTKEW